MKLTNQTFITADTHFGHKRIAELQVRPENFEEVIVDNWNKVVGKHDKVLHLGDLVLSNKEEAIKICKRLNGEKYLIKGNHDHASDTWYKDCGFTVIEPIYKVMEMYGCNMEVLFTHEPVEKLPEPLFNIHGHMHNHTHRDFGFETIRHYDAGVDLNDFTPIRLNLILSTLIVKVVDNI
jgi:calcineurin-like phosphoesterase family protein